MSRDIKFGIFREPDNSHMVERMVDRLRASDSDWVVIEDYIAVRCYQDPKHYSVVVARVIGERDFTETS